MRKKPVTTRTKDQAAKEKKINSGNNMHVGGFFDFDFV